MTQLPQEIETFYIIPAIRKELILSLVKLGLTQREAGKRLGITEGAASHYVKQRRGCELKFNRTMKEEIKRSANRILKKEDSMKEINRLVGLCRANRIVCKVHQKHGASKDCRLCFKE